jgi:sugar phosphate isomerase/epimerase
MTKEDRMEIGIYTRTFDRPTLEGTLDAVAAHGIHYVQFNFANAGVPTLPDQIDLALVDRVRAAMDARKIMFASVAGTYNMIDPDFARRRHGMQRLAVLAEASRLLGNRVITLCSGTHDRENMWRRHPDNDTPEAWRDMVEAMTQAASIAEANDVVVAFEPEVSNVVDSAAKARRVLDEVRSSHLKVVMDGANIFHRGELPRMAEILDEAFQLLGDDVVLAHAKDLDHDGEAGHLAAGHGMLDYDRYVQLLKEVSYSGALVLHGLAEDQIDSCVAFLRGKVDERCR